jgi:hypothetical protein
MSEMHKAVTRADEAGKLLPQAREDWFVPGANDRLDRTVILDRFTAIKDANLQVLGGQIAGAEATAVLRDYDASVEFVQHGFDEFEANEPSAEHFDWAFMVPVRGEESQGNRYASEVTDFLPILDPSHGVGPAALQRTVAHLAPVKIETYQGDDETKGMILFTPAYFDPVVRDYRNPLAREMVYGARRRVDEAARLVRQRYGVGLVGLGAVLPGVTQLGRTIKEPGLVTTTGHGGTVHLLAETVEYAAELQDKEPVVGVLGLGSIGRSSLDVLRSKSPDAATKSTLAREYVLYDTDDARVRDAFKSEGYGKISGATSEHALLAQSDIIVTAITDTIDLDALEAKHGAPLDLTGKVIVDDSQPGCFSREQVEARGGKLVWVVGADRSDSKFLHRVGGYSYGNESGLYGEDSGWGCEAEAGTLATLHRPDLAVATHVTPEIARAIGAACRQAGIRVASPLQSFGKPVEF